MLLRGGLLSLKAQPLTSSGIDWSNPLSHGLIAWTTPVGSGHKDSTANGSNFRVNSRAAAGPSGIFSGGSTRGNFSGLLDQQGMSLVTRLAVPAAHASFPAIYLGYYVSGTDNFGFGIQLDGGLSVIQPLGRVDSNSTSTGSPSFAYTTPYDEHLMVTVSAWSALNIYRNASSTAAITTTTVGSAYKADVRKSLSANSSPIGAAYTFLYNRILSNAEDRQIRDNPWQLLAQTRRIWAPVSAGGGADGNASTTPATSTLTAPTATGSGSAQASTAPTGSTLTAPTATAAGAAATSATPAAVTLAPPTASATGSAAASSTPAAVTISPLAASAAGAALGTTTPATITLVAPTGVADGSGSGNAFADFMAVVLAPITGLATGAAAASGDLSTLTLDPAAGTASGAATATIGRPASDTSQGTWTASTGSDLYAMINEVTPDAANYIVTTSTGSICEMPLQTTVWPGTASQKLSYRASSSTGNSVIVRLKNTGGATVRSETQVLTSTDTLYEITLTAPEIAAITSGALSVQLESA